MADKNLMRLLHGKPIKVDLFKIKPWTLEEIDEFGEDRYNEFIGNVLVTKDRLKDSDSIDQEFLNELTTYQVFCGLFFSDKRLMKLILDGLKVTFGTQAYFDEFEGAYIRHSGEEFYLDDKSFEKIQEIVSLQNYIAFKKNKEDGYKPANSKAAELREKLLKAREKALSNKDNGESLKLTDIISIVSAYSSSTNMIDIWKLTVYQVFVLYERLLLWDDFHIKQQLLPHLEEGSIDKMKHWTKPISPNNKEEK